jgi:hypothetical protein
VGGGRIFPFPIRSNLAYGNESAESRAQRSEDLLLIMLNSGRDGVGVFGRGKRWSE